MPLVAGRLVCDASLDILIWDINSRHATVLLMDRKRRAARTAVLANLLRSAREEANLTQAEVADRLCAPQSFVSKVESGARRLDLGELRDLTRAMDVPLATIVKRFEVALDFLDKTTR